MHTVEPYLKKHMQNDARQEDVQQLLREKNVNSRFFTGSKSRNEYKWARTPPKN